jgi:ribosomal protein S18 acetylase RimI-like enzyme
VSSDAAYSDDGLYARGCATLLASWQAYTQGARGARLHRRPGVCIAAFPEGPERTVYNNALLERHLGPRARAAAIDELTSTYADARIESFAAWVHESDDDLRADLEDRGFRLDTWTRAMGMPLDELRPAPVDPRVEVADLGAHLRTIGLPDLLAGVDPQRFRAVVAPGVEPVSTGLSFDHEGDCGIFNVSTAEGARRRGLGSAVTAALLRGATGANCLTASLQSTPMAAALYTAMGFRDLGRLLEYVPPT